MCRARCLLPVLIALAASGCMPSENGRGFLAASPSPQHAVATQADIDVRAAGPRAYVVRYRAPAVAPASAVGGPYAARVEAAQAYAAMPRQTTYTLDTGDKLRIVVFGQEGITGSYMVDASGHVSLPLIGSVPARDTTPETLSRAIAERLKKGFVRDPNVTVEVEAYRPFFILGEVTTPGQYAYVPNMTAETAVAIAGGFTPRAFKDTVQITRRQQKMEAPITSAVRPGDTVVVKERWF